MDEHQKPPIAKVKQFLGLLIIIFGYVGMLYFSYDELEQGNWPLEVFAVFMIIIGIGIYYVVDGAKGNT